MMADPVSRVLLARGLGRTIAASSVRESDQRACLVRAQCTQRDQNHATQSHHRRATQIGRGDARAHQRLCRY